MNYHLMKLKVTLFFSYSSESAPDPEISSKSAVLSFGFFIAIDSTAPCVCSSINRQESLPKNASHQIQNLEDEEVLGLGIDPNLLQFSQILFWAYLGGGNTKLKASNVELNHGKTSNICPKNLDTYRLVVNLMVSRGSLDAPGEGLLNHPAVRLDVEDGRHRSF